MKIVKKKSNENCHFYSCEKLLYIAWACFRNDNNCQSHGRLDIIVLSRIGQSYVDHILQLY